MRILLYNPDNGVTSNFMPHLWMFLLQEITPPGHEVLLLDGNARAMDEDAVARFVVDERIDLVGIGAMTRMVAKAYRVADAVRATGVPVVMGGPHVTEMPDEALGLDGGPRHADAVALGEADETWPRIVEDARRGELRERYEPVDASGKERKPSLRPYPEIPWETLDLDQFDLVPSVLAPALSRLGTGWGKFHVIPIESGRGCPYGCEFCTVTGFFGDSVRFRTDESVVEELLRLKARARAERGQVSVFFVDDNFAISPKRTKSLLRAIIAADARIPWGAQISANLLRDEELVDLIAEAGGKWVFIGMESIDPANLADVHKTFNKPHEYGAVMERLARRDIFAVTSFIFGMDNDTPGVAWRTLEQTRTWPPGLPVFGQLTPFPSTPLYARLEAAGRLTRPKHWMDFAPFRMAHTPLKMTPDVVQAEFDEAWQASYNPAAIEHALESLAHKPFAFRLTHFLVRLFFRGIYFPQRGIWGWTKVIASNRRSVRKLAAEGVRAWRRASVSPVGDDRRLGGVVANMPHKDIVVVGGSAGCLDTLRTIVSELPTDFPAAVLVVVHCSPDSPALLAAILDRAGTLPAAHAADGERVRHGRVYVAPPDRHLVLEPDAVRLTRGPKENRFRPAIDPLFRSAAQVYGPRAVGVLLSGGLDDGSAGLLAIKQLGGTAVVQDPAEALFPSMPSNALATVRVDSCLPARDIAAELVRLASTDADEREGQTVPDDLEIEVLIAKGDEAIAAGVRRLGRASSYTCPACHGVLLQLDEGGLLRFRCHTGHAYSVESLLEEINEAIEGAVWNALRSIDEGVLFFRQIAEHLAEKHGAGERLLALAKVSERRAEMIRRIVVDPAEPALFAGFGEETLTRSASRPTGDRPASGRSNP